MNARQIIEGESAKLFMKKEAPRGEPVFVWNREGNERGELTGSKRPCKGECAGTSLGAQWPDGEITWCCTRGMFIREDGQYQLR